MPDSPLDALRLHARSVAERAYVPYSRRSVGAALLLRDGTWVPGVRIENAAFPLLIPALLTATSTARCAGRADVVAVAQTQALDLADAAYLHEAYGIDWQPAGPDVLIAVAPGELPSPSKPLDPFLDHPAPASDAAGVMLALEAATHAHIPASNFPVGCVIETEDGRLLPGCNVEHADWTRGLCAERVALGTALSYGIARFRRLYLACPKAPGATPCGACRQVLAELAPGLPIVMARGLQPAEVTTPEALLPGAFGGKDLRA